MDTVDVLVIGGGPAGRATARACLEAGLEARCVDPAPERPWPNTYGVWVDTFAAMGLQGCLGPTWPRAEVALDAERAITLPRAYGLVDRPALRAALDAPCEMGEVATLVHDDAGTVVTFVDGRSLRARVVVDATGHRGRFTRRGGRSAPGFQAAWGIEVTVRGHPFPLDAMRLMDFSGVPEAPPRPPTFLYAMPFGPRRLFVEETVLVGRPPTPFPALEARLRARLAHLGIVVEAIHATERCLIPMGLPLPRRGQRVVAIGGAASMVHPATGYMLARTLAVARGLGVTFAAALAAGGPIAAAEAGWRAIWPRERRRVWAIFRFGMEALLRLDQAQTRAFFAAFFTVDPAASARWLAGDLSVSEATAVMRAVFAALPGGLRARLVAQGMGPHGWSLLGALLG